MGLAYGGVLFGTLFRSRCPWRNTVGADSISARKISCPEARRGNPSCMGNGKGEETRLGVRFSPPLNPSHPLAQMGIPGYCRAVRLIVEITLLFSETVELTHDVAVNSAANPTGHGQKGFVLCTGVCVFKGDGCERSSHCGSIKPSASAMRMTEP